VPRHLVEATAGVFSVLGSAAAWTFELALLESFGLLRESLRLCLDLTPASRKGIDRENFLVGFLEF